MAASESRQGKAHMMIMDRALVIIGRRWRSKWWKIRCSGCRGRRRKDGTCKHERFILDNLKQPFRSRTRIDVDPLPTETP